MTQTIKRGGRQVATGYLSKAMTKTAVVGGGIGGITASLYLRRLGHKVTLYEQSDRLGGRLTYERHGHYEIDQGPTIVLLPQLLKEILMRWDLQMTSMN